MVPVIPASAHTLFHYVAILVLAVIPSLSYCEELTIVDFSQISWRPMPQFWSNTGFCPPAPTNDSFDLHAFFTSDDVRMNMYTIAALPYWVQPIGVRVHWILNLIDVKRLEIILKNIFIESMNIMLFVFITAKGTTKNLSTTLPDWTIF